MTNQLKFNDDGRLIIPKSIQEDYVDLEYSKRTKTPMSMIAMFRKVTQIIAEEKQ